MPAKILTPHIRDAAESLPRKEMETLQLEQLRAGITRVSKYVPFYKEKLAESKVTAESIRSLADLSRLPFTTKSDLRDHYPFGLLAVPMQEVIRLHASSGTTGRPTVVAYTRNDITLWSNLMARAYAAAGVTSNDIIHNAYGYGLFTGGLGFHYGAETIGATVLPISAGNTKRQLMLMRDFGSTVLCCTPSYSLLLAEAAREQGIDLRQLSLKVGLFGAEPWSERMAPRNRSSPRHHRAKCLRPLGSNRPRRFRGMHRQAGPAHQRGSFHPRNHRSRHRATTTRWRTRRTSPNRPDKRSSAANPLPHPRAHQPNPRKMPLRTHNGTHGPLNRPHRRHANHLRRKCFPLAN